MTPDAVVTMCYTPSLKEDEAAVENVGLKCQMTGFPARCSIMFYFEQSSLDDVGKRQTRILYRMVHDWIGHFS